MPVRPTRGVAALALLATLALPAPPADADAAGAAEAGAAEVAGRPCPPGDGVTVVVDHNEIGGADDVVCVPDGGGRSAAEVFADAGVELSYQPQLADFVCRVDGLPTDRPCADSDSFWSLWWSDGTGAWVFSTVGVSGLKAVLPSRGTRARATRLHRTGPWARPAPRSLTSTGRPPTSRPATIPCRPGQRSGSRSSCSARPPWFPS